VLDTQQGGEGSGDWRHGEVRGCAGMKWVSKLAK
jgi:hypothetical protein